MKRRYRRLSREIAQQMRDLYFNRIFKQHQIAEIYGTRQGHVCQIISRQLWK